MAYETYKRIKTKEEFFRAEPEKDKSLSEKIKDQMYGDYVVTCKVIQRDKFTCQNREKVKTDEGEEILKPCKFCGNVPFYPDLTKHHIKAKRNKGKNTVRNQIIICKGSHEAHNAGGDLVFPSDSNLPPRLRKQTFTLHKRDKIDWKAKRAENKALRQKLKNELSETVKKFLQTIPPEHRQWYKLKWEEVVILLNWLNIPYEDLELIEK